jgi:hypothetical protein
MTWRWSAAVAMRERRRGVVVEDDLLPGELAEADEEVPALSRAGDEAAAERSGIKGLVRGDEHRVVPLLTHEHEGRPDTIRCKGLWHHLSNPLRSAPSCAVGRHDDRRVDLL